MRTRATRFTLPALLLASATATTIAAPTTAPTNEEVAAFVKELLAAQHEGASYFQLMDKLEALGPAANVFIPALAEAGKYEPKSGRNNKDNAIHALAAIGTPEAVAALSILLEDRFTRVAASTAMIRLGETAVDGLLASSLRRPEQDNVGPMLALQRIGGPKALAALDKLAPLQTLDRNVKTAKRIADHLRQFNVDQFMPAVRNNTFHYTGELPKVGFSGLEAALTMLDDKDADIRAQGAGHVKRVIDEFRISGRRRFVQAYLKTHQAGINRALTDPNKQVQQLAQSLAKEIGVDTKAADRTLAAKAATRAEKDLFSAASETEKLVALNQLIASRGEAAEPVLRKVIATDSNPQIRRTAATLLLRLPPTDKRIDDAVRGDEPVLRQQAVEALRQQNEAGWRKIFAVASDADPVRRQKIIPYSIDEVGYRVAMAMLETGDAKAMPVAVSVVASRYSEGQPRATQPSAAAIAKVVGMLRQQDASQRKVAIRLLQKTVHLSTGPVLELLKSPNVETRRAAAVTLAGDDGDSGMIKNRLPADALQPLLAAGSDDDVIVRENVAQALARLVDVWGRPDDAAGTVGREAFPAPPEVRGPAIERLTAFWDDADPNVRAAAVVYLAAATDGFNHLRAAERHSNPSVSRLAAYLLQQRTRVPGERPEDTPPPPAVTELVAILNDPQQSRRMKGFMAREVGRHGTAGAPAIPALTALVTHATDVSLRRTAAEALGAVGNGSTAAAAALIAALDDSDTGVVIVALRSVRGLGPVAKNAVPRIIKLLEPGKDAHSAIEESDRRIAAIEALGGTGAAGVPALIAALERGELSAANALQRIGPAAAPAVPVVIQAIRRRTDHLSNETLIKTLGAIGPAAAKDGVPVLTEFLKQPRPRDESAIIEALGRIGPAAATPDVIAALTAPQKVDPRAGAAYQALGAMGPAAASATPALVARLQATLDRRNAERPRPGLGSSVSFGYAEQCAARALGKFGPKAKAALPVLDETLKWAESREDTFSIGVLKQARARISGREPLTSPDYTDVRPPLGPSGD